MQTFLFLASELGAIVGSGIKFATIAKNKTPAKNCIIRKTRISFKANSCQSSHNAMYYNLYRLRDKANPKVAF